jgi:hypothetical protein
MMRLAQDYADRCTDAAKPACAVVMASALARRASPQPALVSDVPIIAYQRIPLAVCQADSSRRCAELALVDPLQRFEIAHLACDSRGKVCPVETVATMAVATFEIYLDLRRPRRLRFLR